MNQIDGCRQCACLSIGSIEAEARGPIVGLTAGPCRATRVVCSIDGLVALAGEVIIFVAVVSL